MHFLRKRDGITDKRTDDPISRCPGGPFRPGHKHTMYLVYLLKRWNAQSKCNINFFFHTHCPYHIYLINAHSSQSGVHLSWERTGLLNTISLVPPAATVGKAILPLRSEGHWWCHFKWPHMPCMKSLSLALQTLWGMLKLVWQIDRTKKYAPIIRFGA